ncbi:ribonuclease D [Corynebacterium deserti GIMN1.010]|uniref:Ribonuclease D n=1 Tax=Corynebacterium deserti GIMN1.010 TaxID=931089 RepID=A0A0M4CE90_9CORY|nr:ribonuclease D [Corynebacterium deserti]ALC06091.1 ribonuclease D [Corynebacterium deserti GIMN1.010]
MVSDLLQPRDGVPPLLATPGEFAAAADVLASGTGPFAIDTERASGFRYDDRAFLIQIRRRGSGTLLFDPEQFRPELSRELGPVLNGQDWIIHAAATDLPSLSWLDLHPGLLFDTELAGRLAGFEHVNLAAMVEDIFGLHLLKGHGSEDWSARPLPESWLNYAALDVEMLLELADVMAEILDTQGKLPWAEQEFEHIANQFADVSEPTPSSWTDLKGLSTLKKPEQLVVARDMWLERDSYAASRDLAPGKVLANKVIVEVARTLPSSPAELARVKGFPGRSRGATNRWFRVVVRALKSPRRNWPSSLPRKDGVPDRRFWSSYYPEEYEVLQEVRAHIDDLGADLAIPGENILQPSTLRAVVWMATNSGEIRDPETLKTVLKDFDVRPWQIQQVFPILSDTLLKR